MATYNIDITSKAIKYFENLNQRIVAMHCKLEPATDADSIKCITNYLHNGYGNWLAIGGKSKEMKFRYIRIVIDVMAGSKTASLKEELMRGTLECCMMYEARRRRIARSRLGGTR